MRIRTEMQDLLQQLVAPLGLEIQATGLCPLAVERLIGRDQKTSPLIPLSDQLEQHAGFGLNFPHIRQIVQDDQVEAVEFGEGRRQLQTLTSDLELLHDFTGAREQHAISSVDQGVSDGTSKMTFAPARRPEQQNRGTFL